MYSPRFRLRSYEMMPHEIKVRIMYRLVEALVLVNAEYLRRHPETPPLYLSGVRYQQEPFGEEEWQDIPYTLKLGYGDCEDLAAWRVAELRVMNNEKARPEVMGRVLPSGMALYHIRVTRADGSIEDPSKLLGMKGQA